jgi:ankyrin repeat protein
MMEAVQFAENPKETLLSTLPNTWESYDANLRDLALHGFGPDSVEALAIKWLAFAAKTMRFTEFEVALSIKYDDPTDLAYQPQYNVDGSVVLSNLSGLVEVSSTTQSNALRDSVIAITHYSLRTYLLDSHMGDKTKGKEAMFRGPVVPTSTNCILGLSCLRYLFYCFQHNQVDSGENLDLQAYSSQNWYKHVSSAQSHTVGPQSPKDELRSQELTNLTLRLLGDWETLQQWLELFNPDGPAANKLQRSKRSSSLYFASLLGLTDVVKKLLAARVDVNAAGWACGNALQAASSRGHGEIVALLLDHNAKAKTLGGFYRTALHAAATEGHAHVVEQLLKHGVPADLKDKDGDTPLMMACLNNHYSVVEKLLSNPKNKADPNGPTERGNRLWPVLHGTPIQIAAKCGHIKVIQKLIELGGQGLASVNSGDLGTALHAAAEFGQVKTVKYLLKRSYVPVNAPGGRYGTALIAAAANSHEDVVKVLLDYDADIHFAGGNHEYKGAMDAAQGYEGIIALLSEKEPGNHLFTDEELLMIPFIPDDVP